MEELFDNPDEFIQPILPCLGLLERGNILIYEKTKTFWAKYFRPWLVVSCVILFYASMTMYMSKVFKGKLGPNELAYVVSVYVVCNQGILKIAIVISKKEEIKALIAQLGRVWRTEDLNEVQSNKKNELLKRLNFCYAVFYGINIFGSWYYILAPLLETVFRKYILQQDCGLLLPFSCSFPFDPSGNWGRYIGVYIFETYSRFEVSQSRTPIIIIMSSCTVFRIIYIYLGPEFLMITLCSHLATTFTLLQEDFLNVKPGNNHAELKAILAHHQELIRLTDQLDNVFDKVIFLDLSSTTISLCFFGFGAKVASGSVDIAKNFIGVVGIICPLFNLCYYGELLREASAGVAVAAYNNLWYRGDTKYQKLLWLVLWRAQKPCCMTSLKYVPIDLTTFTTVLSTTWSYFSLASSLYEEGES